MRVQLFSLVVLGTVTAWVVADENPQRSGRAAMRQLVARFDENRDGRLDAAERAKARAAFSRAGGAAKRTDGGLNDRPHRPARLGAGRLDERERARLRRFLPNDVPEQHGGRRARGAGMSIPPFVLKRFDKDGDGQLDARELAAARRAREGFIRRQRASGRRTPPGMEGGRQGRASFGSVQPRRHRVDKSELVSRFDRNGDGELNASERSTALKELVRRAR